MSATEKMEFPASTSTRQNHDEDVRCVESEATAHVVRVLAQAFEKHAVAEPVYHSS